MIDRPGGQKEEGVESYRGPSIQGYLPRGRDVARVRRARGVGGGGGMCRGGGRGGRTPSGLDASDPPKRPRIDAFILLKDLKTMCTFLS